MEKTGIHGARRPGLSNRSKIPGLLKIRKSPPKKPPALPKVKAKPLKKGQEVYSDEELVGRSMTMVGPALN